MLPSDVYATCFECFNEHHITRYHIGRIDENNCYECHARLCCSIQSISFEQITVPS